MLTDDRLDAARARQLRALRATARVLAPARAGDGRGGHTVAAWTPRPTVRPHWAPADGWPAAGDRVPARASTPSAADLELAADRWAARPHWVVTLPHGTGAQVGDRLELTHRGTTRTVAVVGDYTDGATLAVAQRLATIEAK